jgi:hypothetical protein
VSVNFCHALFSFLDFLTIEAGTDRLFQNFGMELISQTSVILHDLAMQALVWLQCGPVQSDPFCCFIYKFTKTSHT